VTPGEARPERGGLDEVGEGTHAVDLDDRQLRAVAALEIGVAGDVDDGEIEAELVPRGADDLERALAEPAVRSVVDGDPRQGAYG
jgi:hypothetical protein